MPATSLSWSRESKKVAIDRGVRTGSRRHFSRIKARQSPAVRFGRLGSGRTPPVTRHSRPDPPSKHRSASWLATASRIAEPASSTSWDIDGAAVRSDTSTAQAATRRLSKISICHTQAHSSSERADVVGGDLCLGEDPRPLWRRRVLHLVVQLAHRNVTEDVNLLASRDRETREGTPLPAAPLLLFPCASNDASRCGRRRFGLPATSCGG